MTDCRRLDDSVADGFAQMAYDLALLESVDARPGEGAILRFYRWSEPTLSLGYFQEYGRAADDPRWAGRTIVRRPTGGGAIWHEGDLTYALILPVGHPLSGRHTDLYNGVHRAAVEVLRGLGLDARLRGGPPPRGPAEFLCFLDREPTDVVAGGSKVLGSAQRRKRGAILQHGSLLLESPPEIPGLVGIRDALGTPVDLPKLVDDLIRGIGESVGLAIRPGPPGEDAIARKSAIHGRLRESSWLRRR